MQVAGEWARSRGKFSGSDFPLLDQQTLQCPAGHSMYRREVHQNHWGDLLILFGINPRTFQQCPYKPKCLADGSKGTGGQRITLIRKKLLSPPTEPQSVVELQPIEVTHSTIEQTLPVLRNVISLTSICFCPGYARPAQKNHSRKRKF